MVRFETPAGQQVQVDFAEFRFPWGTRYALLFDQPKAVIIDDRWAISMPSGSAGSKSDLLLSAGRNCCALTPI